MSTDRIAKTMLLRAPRARVWQALAEAEEFGHWFGFEFDGPFFPGAHRRGVLVGTKVNADVAKGQKTHGGLTFDITIEHMEAERTFSFRWHPHAVERDVDYSLEPTTLVVFTLAEVPEGVRLTVTESGFDRVPLERRAKAFAANSQGWEIMVGVLEEHLANACQLGS